MIARPDPIYTSAEYLEMERNSDYKSELVNGRIYAMAGASWAHTVIANDIQTALRMRLRGKPCQPVSLDMRLKVSETGMYTYPDVMVICGDPALEDVDGDTVVNPTVVVEVLSPSTEAYDRGDKFAHYRCLETLREYILVSQDSAQMEMFTRRDDGTWLLTECHGRDGSLFIASIDVTLPAAEVYERVGLGRLGVADRGVRTTEGTSNDPR